jgi:hypothetical protein
VLGVAPVLSAARRHDQAWSWYSVYVGHLEFALLTLLAFLAWTMTGIYRLLRSELQMENGPWVWLGFMGFLMVYTAGFVPEDSFSQWPPVGDYRLFCVFGVAALSTYLMALSERKDPVSFERLWVAAREKRVQRALGELPCWAISLGVTVLAGLIAATHSLLTAQLAGAGLYPTLLVATTILFVLRDLGLLLFFNLGRNPKRADMLTVVFLALLYFVIPGIFSALDFNLMTSLFWPRIDLQPGFGLGAALVEVAAVLALLIRRWQRIRAFAA